MKRLSTTIIRRHTSLRRYYVTSIKAMAAFRKMQKNQITPNQLTWYRLLKSYAIDSRPINDIWQELKASGMKPNVVNYNIAIHATGRCFDIKGCVDLFEEMKVAGCDPDASTYHKLLKACSQVKPNQPFPPSNLAVASRIWVEARSNRERFLNSGTYGAYLTVLAKAGEWQKALEVKQLADEDGWTTLDQFHYDNIMEACANAGKLQEAMKVFEEAKRMGKAYNVVYTRVVKIHADRDDWKTAEHFLEEAVRRRFRPTYQALSSLLAGYGRANQLDRARAVLHLIKPQFGVKPTLALVDSVITGLWESGYRPACERIYLDGLEVVKTGRLLPRPLMASLNLEFSISPALACTSVFNALRQQSSHLTVCLARDIDTLNTRKTLVEFLNLNGISFKETEYKIEISIEPSLYNFKLA